MIWPGYFVGVLFLLAAGPQFDITDARGKKPSGVVIETGSPDADGWMDLKLAGKPKVPHTLIWPYDGKAKDLEGPGAVNVLVIPTADEKALQAPKVMAAFLVRHMLVPAPPARDHVGLDIAAGVLEKTTDYWQKGVALLYLNKAADAVEPLGKALRERERVLTRIPSEIYPAAMLYGRALFDAGKFDDAALAYLKASKLRPSEVAPKKARAEALMKAGKPEAAAAALEQD